MTENISKSKFFSINMKEVDIFFRVRNDFGLIHSKSCANRDFNWASQAQNFLVGRHISAT
jgi:hypothetical protein